MEDKEVANKNLGMFYGAMPIIFEKAKALRKNMTKAEEIVWGFLKTNPLESKFRRQHPIAIYIADFYCHSLKLVIEVDGDIHLKEEVKRNDAEREANLKNLGLNVVRFTNKEIFANSYEIELAIIKKIEELKSISNSKFSTSLNEKAPLGVGVNSPFRGLGGKGTIRFKASSTIANLVCGFDILGLAVNAPYDEMEMELLDKPEINITHLDKFNLPTKAEENVAGVALLALLNAYENKNIGFNVTINKLIKPGSGLGSSAASAAGAVLGANQLLGNPFSNQEIVGFAMYGEHLASGAMHADNVAPCIYGGVTLIRSTNPLDIVPLNAPPIYVTIVHPQIEIKTAEARAILPKEILLKDAVTQWANVAGLVAGFLQNDYELIGRSLDDVIVEPHRSKLIPGFDEVKQKSKAAGALGGGISGSGPSIFMLSKDEATAKKVEQVMKEVYEKIGLLHYTYVTTIK